MTATQRQYLVIRMVATNELRISPVVAGFVPKPDPEYTWGGPYKSKAAANKAVADGCPKLAAQLYPEGK